MTATFSEAGSYELQLTVSSGTVHIPANLTVDVLDPATVPLAPENVVATAGENSVFLDWDDNSEPDLVRYVVSRSETLGSGYVVIADNVTLSEYLDEDVNLVNGTTYYYRVTVVDSDGDVSPPSDEEASATPQSIPPVPPASLVAIQGDACVSLIWDDNNESDLAGYRIYRRTSSQSYDFNNPLATTDPYTSEYLNDVLTNGITYYYVVCACDSRGNESASSNEVSATPQEPFVLADVSFGSNSNGYDGFTESTATLNMLQEAWSLETDSIRYSNDDPDGIADSGADGGTENASLLKAFALNRSIGKSYIIEGVIELTSGYADDNNRMGIYLFGDVSDLTVPGGPEENEAGALCLLYNSDTGKVRLCEGIDLNPLANASTGRAEDDTIFGVGNTVTFAAEIVFLESGGTDQIQIVGSFTDENGVTTSLPEVVTPATILVLPRALVTEG